ncbi:MULTISPECIES: hypothetical protein [Micromonospora]|uniref:Uncharacterized protein n=1 Tax=Micromonospora sicca TaxID=2202420 RepID=A0A317DDQ9_9ACTN|nr:MULTISPECIES: hypothetical protein [unclassified Micromonospora]MBM0228014.1 hypothetical protein [Micromonospora sp. ATA51]PWR12971.1 hypothetical protein DKT69_22425 [Micromonospora sp. 4G51]
MRAARMMILLLQLQVRGQASARELARQLEVGEGPCSGTSRRCWPPGYRCGRPAGRRADTVWTAATAPG